MSETWTILRVLQWTTEYFGQKGIDQPRATAEVLLAWVLSIERIGLYLRYDQPLSREELDRFRKVIKRRAAREPTQYITGRQEFWSLELEVGPGVLIPRPETERLVEIALDIRGSGSQRVLDLATGSGAIAVALAHERPAWRIVATDVSSKALRVAKRNAIKHGVADRIHFAVVDLFGALADGRALFDLVVSNPPYIGDVEFEQLAPEISDHEPRSALLGGGTEGLETILSIIHMAPDFMRAKAHLLIEIGMGQDELLAEKLQSGSGLKELRFLSDYSGVKRVLMAQRASL